MLPSLLGFSARITGAHGAAPMASLSVASSGSEMRRIIGWATTTTTTATVTTNPNMPGATQNPPLSQHAMIGAAPVGPLAMSRHYHTTHAAEAGAKSRTHSSKRPRGPGAGVDRKQAASSTTVTPSAQQGSGSNDDEKATAASGEGE